jgi:hypothetical protein
MPQLTLMTLQKTGLLPWRDDIVFLTSPAILCLMYLRPDADLFRSRAAGNAVVATES